MRKVEVPTGSVPEFELAGTAVDIQRRREGREAREMEEAQKQREEEEVRTQETHSQEEEEAEKWSRTEKNDTETETGGEAGTSVMIQEGACDQHPPDGLG